MLQWGSANPLQLYCVHSPSIKIKENYGFLAYPKVMNKKIFCYVNNATVFCVEAQKLRLKIHYALKYMAAISDAS